VCLPVPEEAWDSDGNAGTGSLDAGYSCASDEYL
jgi:hypothetical protein